MKLLKLTRTSTHKLFIGGYETIEPSVSLTAELEEGDTLEDANLQLNSLLEEAHISATMHELRLVAKRRRGQVVEKDKVPELIGAMKTMLRGE